MALTPINSYTHSIADYNVSIIGPALAPVLLEAGDDTALFRYERTVEKHMMKGDARGNQTFSRNPDRSGKITLLFLHTSPANAQIQSLLATASAVGELDNPINFNIIINNDKGVPFIRGNKCKIERQPSSERGREVGTNEWVILCAELLINEVGIAADV